MNNEAQRIISRLDEILRNDNNDSADQLGSYIVGATLVRDDIEQYYQQYPLLERIAELGADLETLGGTSHADEVLAEIRDTFRVLKQQASK